MSKTYTRKSYQVESIQWTGTNIIQVMDFIGKQMKILKDCSLVNEDLYIKIDSYIIKDMGNLTAKTSEAFHELYE